MSSGTQTSVSGYGTGGSSASQSRKSSKSSMSVDVPPRNRQHLQTTKSTDTATIETTTQVAYPKERSSGRQGSESSANHEIKRPGINTVSTCSDNSKSRPRCRLSDDGRPTVPKRTSSIGNLNARERRPSRPDPIQLHRQSCQIFSTINETIAQDRSSIATGVSSTLAVTGTATSDFYQISSHMVSASSSLLPSLPFMEDSPLGHMLARKRTSLPSNEDHRTSRPSLKLRDSYLSSRSSFLSAFPEPPVSTTMSPQPPLPSQSPLSAFHQRNASQYRVFPIQPQPGEESPTAMPLMGPSRPPITTTPSYTSSPILNHEGVYMQNPTSVTSISWTSPATRQAEYIKIDQARGVTRKVLRTFMPRWLCGSLGGERGAFYGDERDDQRSVRRFRIEGAATDEKSDEFTEKSDEERMGSSCGLMSKKVEKDQYNTINRLDRSVTKLTTKKKSNLKDMFTCI